jgi:hypothetical protein
VAIRAVNQPVRVDAARVARSARDAGARRGAQREISPAAPTGNEGLAQGVANRAVNQPLGAGTVRARPTAGRPAPPEAWNGLAPSVPTGDDDVLRLVAERAVNQRVGADAPSSEARNGLARVVAGSIARQATGRARRCETRSERRPPPTAPA